MATPTKKLLIIEVMILEEQSIGPAQMLKGEVRRAATQPLAFMEPLVEMPNALCLWFIRHLEYAQHHMYHIQKKMAI